MTVLENKDCGQLFDILAELHPEFMELWRNYGAAAGKAADELEKAPSELKRICMDYKKAVGLMRKDDIEGRLISVEKEFFSALKDGDIAADNDSGRRSFKEKAEEQKSRLQRYFNAAYQQPVELFYPGAISMCRVEGENADRLMIKGAYSAAGFVYGVCGMRMERLIECTAAKMRVIEFMLTVYRLTLEECGKINLKGSVYEDRLKDTAAFAEDEMTSALSWVHNNENSPETELEKRLHTLEMLYEEIRSFTEYTAFKEIFADMQKVVEAALLGQNYLLEEEKESRGEKLLSFRGICGNICRVCFKPLNHTNTPEYRIIVDSQAEHLPSGVHKVLCRIIERATGHEAVSMEEYTEPAEEKYEGYCI